MLMAPCTAGQVVDLVHLDIQREGHVVAHQLEIRVVQQVHDVAPRRGVEIIDAEHVLALGQQPLAQVRAEEAGAAGDQDAFAHRAILPAAAISFAIIRQMTTLNSRLFS
jgi:hypothetical protein